MIRKKKITKEIAFKTIQKLLKLLFHFRSFIIRDFMEHILVLQKMTIQKFISALVLENRLKITSNFE
jgi:hypothetical protein